MDNDFILVVGEGRAAHDAAQALGATHEVKRCLGTSNGSCPAVHRMRCNLRDDAAASVIFFAGEHEFHAPGQWDCVTAGNSPAVAVLEGSSFPVRGRAGFSVVGSKGGPPAIVEAINRALEPAPTDPFGEESL